MGTTNTPALSQIATIDNTQPKVDESITGYGLSSFLQPVQDFTYGLLGYKQNPWMSDPQAFSQLDPKAQYSTAMMGNLWQQNQPPSLLDIGSKIFEGINYFDQRDLMKEQLAMAKAQEARAAEQWKITKDQINEINQVKNKLNTGYRTGSYAPSPTAKQYA